MRRPVKCVGQLAVHMHHILGCGGRWQSSGHATRGMTSHSVMFYCAGQGPAKTRLVFPSSLTQVLGNGTSYTYGPAFIQFNGANWLNSNTFLASVTAVSASALLDAKPCNCCQQPVAAKRVYPADCQGGVQHPQHVVHTLFVLRCCLLCLCRMPHAGRACCVSATAVRSGQGSGSGW